MKITNCAYAACCALRKIARGEGAREAVVRFVELGSMLHCHCMRLHNRCSTFRAWLHDRERGQRKREAGEGVVPDEAATMISTTSKPIRSCNIFTHRAKRAREREADSCVYSRITPLNAPLSDPPSPAAPCCSVVFVPSHSCAEKHSLKQINTLRIVSF